MYWTLEHIPPQNSSNVISNQMLQAFKVEERYIDSIDSSLALLAILVSSDILIIFWNTARLENSQTCRVFQTHQL